MEKINKWFLLLLVFGIVLRLGGLGDALYQDEAVWGYVIREFATYEGITKFIPHPPLAIWGFQFFNLGFVTNAYTMRMLPFIFGIINILLVYFIGRRYFSEKTGRWAGALMLFSFWHYVASLQVDMEGSFLTFILLVTMWSYMEYDHTRQKKWLWVTAFLFGLSMLTKITAVILLPIIGLHLWYSHKKIVPAIKDFIPVFIVGMAFFFSWVGWAYLFNQLLFQHVFGHATSTVVVEGKSFFSVLPLVYFLLWGTALYTFLFGYSFYKRKKEYVVFWLWVLVPLVFYFFVGKDLVATYDRYLMIGIPALALVCGDVIAEFRLHKKELMLGGLFVFFGYFFSLLLNIYGTRVTHSIAYYGALVKSFQWNFLIPLSSSTGPVIKISFLMIALSFIISFFLFLVIWKGKDQVRKSAFAVFLGLLFGFNLFMIVEVMEPLTQPDVSDTMFELYQYVGVNEMPKPYISNMLATAFYGDVEIYENEDHTFNYVMGDELVDQRVDLAIAEEGTILLLDYPGISKDSHIWKRVNECELVYTSVSKGFKSGYVFRC
jgi:4-amino-4-deoxy-L-arabinose transferase-like glycosyltransferase